MRFPLQFPERAVLAAALLLGGALSGAAADGVQFNRDIRPILSDQCFSCHGFDAKKRKAGLRLDVAESAHAANKDGRIAVKPGDLSGSELWARINTTDADDIMPPPDSHKTLAPEQKALLKRWIEQGAKYQRHWSFEVPVRGVPPSTGALHPIDRFIADRLGREGLALSPEADRRTLARRVSLDLTGLTPTPAEVDRFVDDPAPDAYERMVDRFLASPHYGERMARSWLDVARYADTHGLHLDNERQIWAYRDWVVSAFNRNLPFDRFTIDQLAGDLVAGATQDQLIATGFNRCNVSTSEGGSIDAEFIFRYAVDRASTTSQAWMGLTAGCAVCHDHKFDPISTREFYSLYAFFHSAADPAMDGNALLTPPIMKLPTADDSARLAELDSELVRVESGLLAKARTTPYADPAEANPRPPVKDLDSVWVDDDLPTGWKGDTSTGGTSRWVTREEGGQVKRGRRALRREDGGLAQDVFVSGAPMEIPTAPKLYAHVRLEAGKLPRAIMLQYRTDDWKHRMVWGDIDAIDWGAKGTGQRAHGGPLPEAGNWVRLEFDAAKVGLKPGDKITGIAFTQQGGVVHWDEAGVAGQIDPANDPSRSFVAWLKQQQGRDVGELPPDLRKVLKEVAATNRTPAQVTALREQFIARVCSDTRETFQPVIAEMDRVRKRRNELESQIPSTFVWKDLDKPRDSFVMTRGAYDKPGEKVSRGVPAALPPMKSEGTPTRLDLARWLVSPEHPLTARVAVNRLWLQFFGIGLVRTAEDFGSQGEPPSHPELLDWLSVEYRESGWDTKALVRLLVTSATYRQSSVVTPALLAKDPENRLLARGPRFRLDAEQLRDNALFVGGLAVLQMGGKGVRTYQPPNIWEPVGFVGSNTRDYRQDTGAALYRRSLYTFFKRTAPPPFMTTFDAPNREGLCARRERSNTPLQALQLMNDVQYFEAARGLAQRMLRQGGSTPAARVKFGYETVLGRPPSADELAVVLRSLDRGLARYRADKPAAEQAVTFGESKAASDLDVQELAAYTLTANLLLNLDETVTRN
jgi:hypothetical protein